MKLGLQMGHGMLGLVREFLDYEGTRNDLVLSPRNFSKNKSKTGVERMVEFAVGPVKRSSGGVLIDPQLFSTGNATRSLREFPHWLACGGDLWADVPAALSEIAALNDACGTDLFIIPSTIMETVEERRLYELRELASRAREYAGERKALATLSLGQDVLRGEESVSKLLYDIESWDVDGFYIVSEHPRNKYLVDQPLWLYNLMCLVAGIKRMQKLAYVGYASHQMLLLALAGCDRLFSGNYLNVRRFEKSTFEEREERASQRACWYYAPQALSEFKVSTLDLAKAQGMLDRLVSPFGDEKYIGMLFRDALPSDTAYDERSSFMHYLISLNRQCAYFDTDSYDSAYAAVTGYFSTAESLIEGLQDHGINDRGRNFANALPAASQAIAAFNSSWGFQMKQEWLSFKRQH